MQIRRQASQVIFAVQHVNEHVNCELSQFSYQCSKLALPRGNKTIWLITKTKILPESNTHRDEYEQKLKSSERSVERGLTDPHPLGTFESLLVPAIVN